MTRKNNTVAASAEPREDQVTFKDKNVTAPELIKEAGSKSAAIRFLANEQGWKRGPIAKFLGIRYQHVRNVLVTPLKKEQEQNADKTDS